eukprot:gene19777-26469_t
MSKSTRTGVYAPVRLSSPGVGSNRLGHTQRITCPSSHPIPLLYPASASHPSSPVLSATASQQPSNRSRFLPPCSASHSDPSATAPPSKTKSARCAPKGGAESTTSAPSSNPQPAKRAYRGHRPLFGGVTAQAASQPASNPSQPATDTENPDRPGAGWQSTRARLTAPGTATDTASRRHPGNRSQSRRDWAGLTAKRAAADTASRRRQRVYKYSTGARRTAKITDTAISHRQLARSQSERARLTALRTVTALPFPPSEHPPAPQLTESCLDVEKKDNQMHVFWDLDNKQPDFAQDLPLLVSDLKALLEIAGCVCPPMIAYGNTTTCSAWGAASLNEVIERREKKETHFCCKMCGAKKKSSKALVKHFKIHQKEHAKRSGQKGVKAGGSMKKRLDKYAKSEKATKFRNAAATYAIRTKRLGNAIQILKILLHNLGVRLVDVPTTDQTADLALYCHANYLMDNCLDAQSPPQDSDGDAASHKHHTLVVVSDDYGFKDLLEQARRKGLSTIVVCRSEVAPKFTTDFVDAVVHWTSWVNVT